MTITTKCQSVHPDVIERLTSNETLCHHRFMAGPTARKRRPGRAPKRAKKTNDEIIETMRRGIRGWPATRHLRRREGFYVPGGMKLK